jgi:hypothetical protein
MPCLLEVRILFLLFTDQAQGRLYPERSLFASKIVNVHSHSISLERGGKPQRTSCWKCFQMISLCHIISQNAVALSVGEKLLPLCEESDKRDVETLLPSFIGENF